jgi:hypothetical protein
MDGYSEGLFSGGWCLSAGGEAAVLGMGANPAVLAENDAVGPDRWGRLWSDYQLGLRVLPPSTRYQIPLEQAIFLLERLRQRVR